MKDDKWTHSICDDCWDELHPDRLAVKTPKPHKQHCCYCGKVNHSGIYVRTDYRVLAHCGYKKERKQK